jgi:hypothetical protein
MARKYNVKSRRAKRKWRLDQCYQDRAHSSLRLPLGDFVIYPTDRPSIRTLVRRIADLGYLVEVFLFPHKDLQALPLGDQHWAVVIGDAIFVIVPVSISSDSPGDSRDDGSSGFVSGSSRNEPYYDSDNVDPDFPWLGMGYWHSQCFIMDESASLEYQLTFYYCINNLFVWLSKKK